MDEIWIDCRSTHQGHWVRPLAVCRGLAITAHLNWDCSFSAETVVVTHMTSGVRLTRGLSRLSAEQLLSVLTALDEDWSLPKDRLLEELAPLRTALEQLIVEAEAEG